MKIHHLDCGTMCPLATGGTEFVCHVLLLETEAGLVLVDSGYGMGDIENPKRIGPARHILRPRFDPAQTAIRQIEGLGLDPTDVRHIVLTHLDIDHCGALGDFPGAAVHVMAAEHAAATDPPTFADKNRYFPAQWAHGPDWRLHDADGGDRFEGFESVRPIAELGDRVAMVPLPGHTRGHAAVAVDAGDRWLLHAGDAYFHRNSVPPGGGAPSAPPRTIRLFERVVAIQNGLRKENLARLQELAAATTDRIRVFPAHDGVELEALKGE